MNRRMIERGGNRFHEWWGEVSNPLDLKIRIVVGVILIVAGIMQLYKMGILR